MALTNASFAVDAGALQDLLELLAKGLLVEVPRHGRRKVRVTQHVGHEDVRQDFREEKDAQVFLLPLIVHHALLDHRDEVGFRDSLQLGLPAAFGLRTTVGERAVQDARCSHRRFEEGAEQVADQRVEAVLSVHRNQLVAEIPSRFVREDFREIGGAEIVAQKSRDPCGEISRREDVVPRVLQRELRPYLCIQSLRVKVRHGAEGRLQKDVVDRRQLGPLRIVKVHDPDARGEARREREAPRGSRRVHARDNLNPLDAQKLQIFVVEATVGQELLKERDQHARVVHVWPRQVDVFEVQHELLAVAGTVHPPVWRAEERARRGNLRDDVLGGRLRIAVQRCHCRSFPLREGVHDAHVLAAALGAHDQERVVALHQRAESVDGPLHGYRWDDCVRAELLGVQAPFRRVALESAGTPVAVQRFAHVRRPFVRPLVDLLGQPHAVGMHQVASQAANQSHDERTTAVHVMKLAQSVQDAAHQCGLYDGVQLLRGLQRLEEEFIDPIAQRHAHVFRLRAQPLVHNPPDVHVFVAEEDHAHARHRRRRGEAQVVRLEEEVHVRPETDSLAVGKRQQVVVVEDGVETLDPLRIHVSIAHDPRAHLGRLFHDEPRRGGEYPVAPLPRVQVHVAQEALAVHGLGIHDVHLHLLPTVLKRSAQDVPHRRLSAAARSHDHATHALIEGLLQLQHLPDLRLVLLQEEWLVDHDLSNRRLQVTATHVAALHSREDVGNEREELLRVVERELGKGVHPDRLDQQLALEVDRQRRPLPLERENELAARVQDRLQGAEAPVVVLLLAEQLATEQEDADNLAGQVLGALEALAVEDHLRDQLVVRLAHGDGTEQSFQVVRQLAASAIVLPGRVESDEDASVEVDIRRSAQQLDLPTPAFDGILDDLDLLRDGGQLILLEPIELVETAPRAALHQTDEHPSHGLEVDAFVTVLDQHLPAEGVAQRLDRLGFARAGRPVGISPKAVLHRLRQGEKALIGVVEGRVVHDHLGAAAFHVGAQLLLPLPVIHGAHLLSLELVDHVQIVNEVQHQSLHLEIEKTLLGEVLPRELLQQRPQIALELAERLLFDCHLYVSGEVNELRHAEHLAGEHLVVQLRLQTGRELGFERVLHLLCKALEPFLHLVTELDRILKRDPLAFGAQERHDFGGAPVLDIGERDSVDPLEELFQVRLDDVGVLGLAEDLEKIVVPDEVEARHARALLLQELGQGLLAALQLIQLRLETVLQPRKEHVVREVEELRLPVDPRHDVSELLIDSSKPGGLGGQGAATEDRLEVHPLPLDAVHGREADVQNGELRLVCGALVRERPEEAGFLQGGQQGLLVSQFQEQVLPFLDERRSAPVLLMFQEAELGGLGPGHQLLQRLADRHLSLGLGIQMLHEFQQTGLGQLLQHVDEMLRGEVLQPHPASDAQLSLKERRPVLFLERVASAVLQHRHGSLDAIHFGLQILRDNVVRALFVARRELVCPARSKILQSKDIRAERDPIRAPQGGFLGVKLLEHVPAGHGEVQVVLQRSQAFKARSGHAEVRAILCERLRLLPKFGEALLELIQRCKGLLDAVLGPVRHLLGLQRIPPLMELFHGDVGADDLVLQDLLQSLLLLVDDVVEGLHADVEFVPAPSLALEVRHAAGHLARVDLRAWGVLHEKVPQDLAPGAGLLHLVPCLVQLLPVLLRGADFLDGVGAVAELLHRLVQEAVHLLELTQNALPQHDQHRVTELLQVIFDPSLERRVADPHRVDLLAVRKPVAVLSLGREQLEGILKVGSFNALRFHDGVLILERRQHGPGLQLLQQAFQVVEELLGLGKDPAQGRRIPLRHGAEDVVPLGQTTEDVRNAHELLHLPVVGAAQLLERWLEDQASASEADLATDFREVLIQRVEACLIAGLDGFVELVVPMRLPPRHVLLGVLLAQAFHELPQTLPLGVPQITLAQDIDAHQGHDLLGHFLVQLPQAAVLVVQPRRRVLKTSDVVLALHWVSPRDFFAAASGAG
eukprot:scaffold1154_cov310-Pinguiococcus_pyrenoidosus.AAC.33